MASPARAEQRRKTREVASRKVGARVDPLGETSLAVGYCTPGHVDAEFLRSMLDFAHFDAENYGHYIKRGMFIHNETGPRLASARNAIVRMMVEDSDCEYLLMVDTDMGFRGPDVYRLLDVMRTERAKGVKVGMVGGLCFGGGHSTAMFPTIYGYKDEADAKEHTLTRFPFYPVDELLEVHGTGAAFTLMHRDMLEDLAAHFPEPFPWYAETVKAGTAAEYGEDIVLCIRAVALGWKLLVDTSVKIDHYKRAKLNEEQFMVRLGLLDAAQELAREQGLDIPDPNPEGAPDVE